MILAVATENTISEVKGATKLYFMRQSRVVIILFNTGLSRSTYSIYSFGKLVLEVFPCFVFFVFCQSSVLNSIPPLHNHYQYRCHAFCDFLDISRRWRKLNFGPLQGQVKHVIFLKGETQGDNIFTFYSNFLE